MGTINITLGEFKNFMYNDSQYGLYYELITVGNEYVFESDLGESMKLRIFTSIAEGDTTVRDKNDAIRVVIADENDVVDGKSHTKRTPGYRDRINSKIEALVGCGKCGNHMRISNGEYGKYWFCTNNNCDNTDSYTYD